MKKLEFNISASAMNLWHESQLQFFFEKIMGADPDTEVPKVYGDAGNVVHEALEKSYDEDAVLLFHQLWKEKRLDNIPGLNGKPLNRDEYYNALMNGLKLLKEKYTDTIHEEFISFNLVDNELAKIDLKGFIDAKHVVGDDVIIVDWKTNSSVKQDKSFYMQGKMYAMLVYLKYRVVPKKVVFEYLKLGQTVEYIYPKEELIEHYKYVMSVVKEIMSKGFDISKYEVGDVSSIFNSHKRKCLDEAGRRELMN